MSNGIIFDIKRFAVHDGPGIRTTVFLKGCPLKCHWCHNPEGIICDPQIMLRERKLDGKSFTEKEPVGRLYSSEEVIGEIEKDRIIIEESGGGVTFSGGEPLMQPAFLIDLLQKSSEMGFHTTVDTSGYSLRKVLEDIVPFTNLFLYDLKVMDETLHFKYTGVSNQIILENLEFLTDKGKPVRIRFPLLKGINDSKENIEQTIYFLKRLKGIEQVDLLPYHHIGRSKYERLGMECRMPEKAELNEEELTEMKKIFEKEGFIVKIGG